MIKRIVGVMNVTLQARGWSPLALCGLPLCYSKNRAVSPYFLLSELVPGHSGDYTIDGAIGVIDQEFEKLWAQNDERQPRSPGFGVILSILNLPELHLKRHLTINAQLEVQIDSFCAAVGDRLARMPHDESGLVSALESGELCGFPLKAFAGYAYRSKFTAFWEFVGGLQKP